MSLHSLRFSNYKLAKMSRGIPTGNLDANINYVKMQNQSLQQVEEQIKSFAKKHPARPFVQEVQTEWDQLVNEKRTIQKNRDAVLGNFRGLLLRLKDVEAKTAHAVQRRRSLQPQYITAQHRDALPTERRTSLQPQYMERHKGGNLLTQKKTALQREEGLLSFEEEGLLLLDQEEGCLMLELLSIEQEKLHALKEKEERDRSVEGLISSLSLYCETRASMDTKQPAVAANKNPHALSNPGHTNGLQRLDSIPPDAVAALRDLDELLQSEITSLQSDSREHPGGDENIVKEMDVVPSASLEELRTESRQTYSSRRTLSASAINTASSEQTTQEDPMTACGGGSNLSLEQPPTPLRELDAFLWSELGSLHHCSEYPSSDESMVNAMGVAPSANLEEAPPESTKTSLDQITQAFPSIVCARGGGTGLSFEGGTLNSWVDPDMLNHYAQHIHPTPEAPTHKKSCIIS